MRKLLILLLLAAVPPWAAEAGQKKKHSITLKWDAPVAPAGQKIVGYNVYRSDDENGQYKLLAKGVSSLTYVDTTARSGHTYYYRVTSIDVTGRESVAARTQATVP